MTKKVILRETTQKKERKKIGTSQHQCQCHSIEHVSGKQSEMTWFHDSVVNESIKDAFWLPSSQASLCLSSQSVCFRSRGAIKNTCN